MPHPHHHVYMTERHLDLYESFRTNAAQAREVEIGIDLRSAGFGVWQALAPHMLHLCMYQEHGCGSLT